MNTRISGNDTCLSDALFSAGISNDAPAGLTGKEAARFCKKIGLEVLVNCETLVPHKTPVIVFYDGGNGIGHAEFHQDAKDIIPGYKLVGLIVDPYRQYLQHNGI